MSLYRCINPQDHGVLLKKSFFKLLKIHVRDKEKILMLEILKLLGKLHGNFSVKFSAKIQILEEILNFKLLFAKI